MEKQHLKENIFLQMKNFSYDFKNNKFDMDIVSDKQQALYELLEDENNFFIYVNLKQTNNLIKIYYSKLLYLEEVSKIYKQIVLNFILLLFIAILISILFSFYSLYPLQQSYSILKEFIKDIIHDINTPISSIKLNLSLLDKKDDEIISIAQSINTLEMLHKNLDNYLNNSVVNLSEYEIKQILDEQINFFMNLYDWLDWEIDIDNTIIKTDKYIFSRVIYNLLNNACKYNTKNGFIKVSFKNGSLYIKNSSYGIKNIKKVFNRFYKESDRGLGIGLHIVKKLLVQLDYKYDISIDKNNTVTLKVTI
jgi:signal transduction histidine kinase